MSLFINFNHINIETQQVIKRAWHMKDFENYGFAIRKDGKLDSRYSYADYGGINAPIHMINRLEKEFPILKFEYNGGLSAINRKTNIWLFDYSQSEIESLWAMHNGLKEITTWEFWQALKKLTEKKLQSVGL